MLYMHERNIMTKIENNYNGKKNEIQHFYNSTYLPMRNEVEKLQFSEENDTAFETATDIFNKYYKELQKCEHDLKIKAQSKFSSTFLEEISVYLFKNLPEIKSGTFGIFNKGIYAGLKIDNNGHTAVITKDVDFCIGKKSRIAIDNRPAIDLILPITAVEVKTYLDATMFGEIKSSSKAIRSATPNSRTYVLMGHKNLKDDHIIAARQDSTLSEIFVLRKQEGSLMEPSVIKDYWLEIKTAVQSVTAEDTVSTPGRLLHP